jgi:hypothetical protein
MATKTRRANRKRVAVAAAAFDWVNRVRSMLAALHDTVEQTRREAQRDGNPLADYLDWRQLIELERDLANTTCQANVLYPDNPLQIHIPSPDELMKGGGR